VEDFFFIVGIGFVCAFSRSRDAVGPAFGGRNALDSGNLKMQEKLF
jgi:hypothetical protein